MVCLRSLLPKTLVWLSIASVFFVAIGMPRPIVHSHATEMFSNHQGTGIQLARHLSTFHEAHSACDEHGWHVHWILGVDLENPLPIPSSTSLLGSMQPIAIASHCDGRADLKWFENDWIEGSLSLITDASHSELQLCSRHSRPIAWQNTASSHLRRLSMMSRLSC